MTIYSGPSIKDRIEEELTSAKLPFAHKLLKRLLHIGVAITAFKPLAFGERITADGFVQIVSTKERPEELAEAIKERCGDTVQFGELQIPQGVYFAGYERAQNVWIRRIVDYDFATDNLIQRWDVLVRRK